MNKVDHIMNVVVGYESLEKDELIKDMLSVMTDKQLDHIYWCINNNQPIMTIDDKSLADLRGEYYDDGEDLDDC